MEPIDAAWILLKLAPNQSVCPTCNGTGKSGTDGRFGIPLDCRSCQGTGILSLSPDMMQEEPLTPYE